MESEPRPRKRPSLMSAPVITPESDVRTELTRRFLSDSPLAEFANVVSDPTMQSCATWLLAMK